MHDDAFTELCGLFGAGVRAYTCTCVREPPRPAGEAEVVRRVRALLARVGSRGRERDRFCAEVVRGACIGALGMGQVCGDGSGEAEGERRVQCLEVRQERRPNRRGGARRGERLVCRDSLSIDTERQRSVRRRG